MIGTNVLAAGCVLVTSVAIGLLAHEWVHAVALRLTGVEYTVEFFPGRTEGVIAALAGCPWALVQPLPTGRESAWVLRLAALMPLLLAVPVLALALVGRLPAADDPVATAAVLGWTACALPSPQDFSVAWYAHRILADADDAATETGDVAAVARTSRAD